MSSTGANKESESGTMKNVIDNPATKPAVHTSDDNKPNPDTGVGSSNKGSSGGGANRESDGGMMKNVIDDPTTKPAVPTSDDNKPKSDTGLGSSNKCSSGGAGHKSGENSCDSCHKK